jgi:hypothetical protein
MTFERLSDCILGGTFLVIAPLFPLFAETSTTFLNVAEFSDALTLIIQVLSAVLLGKRLLKNKDNEKKS